MFNLTIAFTLYLFSTKNIILIYIFIKTIYYFLIKINNLSLKHLKETIKIVCKFRGL